MGVIKIIRLGNTGEGFPALFIILKDSFAKKLLWGIPCVITVEDVLCTGWQDNNFVLNLSTVHTVD